MFAADVGSFRAAGISLRTVAYHGNPRVAKTSYRLNGDLVDRSPEILASNRLLGEADLSVDMATVEYLSDVGIRFSMIQGDVLAHLDRPQVSRVYVMVHPDYWSESAVRAIAMQGAAMAMRGMRPVAQLGWVVKDGLSH
jgi:hypothetical protein